MTKTAPARSTVKRTGRVVNGTRDIGAVQNTSHRDQTEWTAFYGGDATPTTHRTRAAAVEALEVAAGLREAPKPKRTRPLYEDGQLRYAGVGAVSQHEGSVPVHLCNTCGDEVVWVRSERTGRNYLANVSRGHHRQRYYIGANVHDCADAVARRLGYSSAERARVAIAEQLAEIEAQAEASSDADDFVTSFLGGDLASALDRVTPEEVYRALRGADIIDSVARRGTDAQQAKVRALHQHLAEIDAADWRLRKADR